MASAATGTLASGAELPKLKLYSWWLSTCAHRVRIALKLKGLDYEYKAVNLLKGEQHTPEYENVNPVKFVPALVDGDLVVSDSFAIILYLEEKYPHIPLLPHDLCKKALNYQVASIVSSTIQPLQNILVLKFIEDEKQKLEWAQCHVSNGFKALEKLLNGQAGKYATGEEVLLADVFLAPQLHYGITAFKIDMTPFPTLVRLHEAYNEHLAFQAALPRLQPDAPSDM